MIVLSRLGLNFMNKIKIILLSLFLLVPKVNGEPIIYSRISSPNLLSLQCKEEKDDFAIKTLKLLGSYPYSDLPLYYEVELSEVIIERPDNIDCMAVLDKQYKHLQNLAMHKGSFSDILLLKHAMRYLEELYEYAPFDKKGKEGRLVLLIKANMDNDKPIYPFLLERFQYR